MNYRISSSRPSSRQFFLALLCVAGSGFSHGAVTVTNWNITGSTVSFDISGTIGSGGGSLLTHYLYLGVPGDVSWVVADSSAQSITNHAGATRTISLTDVNYINSGVGDYIYLRTSDATPYLETDVVDASVSISGGTINTLDPTNVIVAHGANTTSFPFPDATAQVGSYSSVPEPGAASLMLAAFGLFAVRRRRRPRGC